MKTLFSILLLVGLIKSSFSCTVIDNKTLTEKLFKGEAVTIFTCKILTIIIPKIDSNTIKTFKNDSNTIIIDEEPNSNISWTATAEIVQVYFGKVDTNIITLKSWSILQIGKTYLVFTSGNGKIFSGKCDNIADSPDLAYEVQIIKQFSDIFKNKSTVKFTFTNSKGVIIAEGQYLKGKPIKVWKHFYDNGIIKSEYDLKKNVTSQYLANGFIYSKSTVNKNVVINEQYSNTVNGQVKFKYEEFLNDSGSVMLTYLYYDNGNINNLYGEIFIENKRSNSSSSTGKTGIYKVYYENGKLKLKGQYDHNRRIGLWKWYNENGTFDAEFDFKDGKGNQ